ncbi:DNA alkylation repair protein [Candidatus Nomurabacteria bacterium]|nr:DNA alkylation repair protein [Candidatus Nomurabacteria bacterium]
MTSKILEEIYSYRDAKKAKLLSGFFKTGRGQYGEGDVFWGLTVPTSRTIAKKYKDINFKEVNSLLKHKVHEVRLVAILILVHKYNFGKLSEKKKIVDFYLKNTKYINNWDLVDLSASRILGDYLFDKSDKKILLKLANSKKLWEQRISMISTLAFIKNGELEWTFKIAKMFLNHKHDLMHKATGWMLREAGKKDEKALRNFLDKNISNMPRTMLRYAIERFSENIRLEYLKK